jgi:hypothetical protein
MFSTSELWTTKKNSKKNYPQRGGKAQHGSRRGPELHDDIDAGAWSYRSRQKPGSQANVEDTTARPHIRQRN